MAKKDTQALRPEFHQTLVEKETEVLIISEEEKVLAAGSVNEFWQVLRKLFDTTIQQLEQVNDQAISKGLPEAEIGRNTIVLSLVKQSLRGIINKVEDAKEYQDKEALDGRGAKQ